MLYDSSADPPRFNPRQISRSLPGICVRSNRTRAPLCDASESMQPFCERRQRDPYAQPQQDKSPGNVELFGSNILNSAALFLYFFHALCYAVFTGCE